MYYYYKMTKEMSVHCDFLTSSLTCILPETHNGHDVKSKNEIRGTYVQRRHVYKDIEI